MPQNVRYTAQRSLVSGHTAGSVYYLDLPLSRKDRERKVRKDAQESLNGAVYTTYHHGRIHWQCATRALTPTETLAMREFLDSVEDGQSFQFDPTYAVGSSPSAYRAVVLMGTGYREERHQTGGVQSAHSFSFKFELREVP